MTFCLGVYFCGIGLSQTHCQIIEKPCGLIASKKKRRRRGDLLHMLNLKNNHANLYFSGREFEGEEEYLEILGITREQSGKYECKAANEVSSADVKQVKVTVNCEYGSSQQVLCARAHLHFQGALQIPLAKEHCISSRCSSGQGCTFIDSTHPRAAFGL